MIMWGAHDNKKAKRHKETQGKIFSNPLCVIQTFEVYKFISHQNWWCRSKEFYKKALDTDPTHAEPVYSDAREKLKEMEKGEL